MCLLGVLIFYIVHVQFLFDLNSGVHQEILGVREDFRFLRVLSAAEIIDWVKWERELSIEFIDSKESVGKEKFKSDKFEKRVEIKLESGMFLFL